MPRTRPSVRANARAAAEIAALLARSVAWRLTTALIGDLTAYPEPVWFGLAGKVTPMRHLFLAAREIRPVWGRGIIGVKPPEGIGPLRLAVEFDNERRPGPAVDRMGGFGGFGLRQGPCLHSLCRRGGVSDGLRPTGLFITPRQVALLAYLVVASARLGLLVPPARPA